MAPKILSMREAGCSVDRGWGFRRTDLEAAIPFAVGHEIIRRGKKDLTLVGPISDILFDQVIGAGAVKKVIAAWVGNVTMGVGYNMRRAVESGVPRKIVVEDHTNFSISWPFRQVPLEFLLSQQKLSWEQD